MPRAPSGWCAVWAGLAAAALLGGCASPAPVRIGFAGELTGLQSDLGIQGRDGALLAVDDLNAAGGLDGRPLELLIEDDRGTPEGAVAADRALISANVVAIIGHMTSGQTLAGLAVTEPAGLVMLSPTASTTELSGQDDLFFRVISPAPDLAAALSRHAFQAQGLRRLAIILDLDNAGYSRAFADGFTADLQAAGGQVIERLEISSAAKPDFAGLAQALRVAGPDAVLIVMSAADAAVLAQQVRLAGWEVPLLAAPWAQTETILRTGGQAVEGMVFSSPFDTTRQTPDYLDFRRRFTERFGREPGFAAAMAYESVHVLAAALRTTQGSAEGLAAALKDIPPVSVLDSVIALDANGDVVRPVALVTIQSGAFAPLGAVTLAPP